MAFADQVWIEVRVVVPPAAVDPISGFLFEKGSLGVTEEEGSDPARGPFVLLRAYFDTAAFPREAFQAELGAALQAAGAGKPRIWVEELPYGDWAEGWKKFFKPRPVGSRFLVAPSWEEVDSAGERLLLRVDPGMAFGTGQHETTSLCLEALETRVGPGDRVLDVGTGSGILAIGAVLLGAAEATGIDVDPEAITAARENVSANGLDGKVAIAPTPLGEVPGTFDVVVANILADTLVALAGELTRHLSPGGRLILSGVLGPQAERVAAAFSTLTPEPVLKAGEWVCLPFRKASAAP